MCDAGAPSSICSHTSSARGKGGCAWSLAERLGPKRSLCRRNLSFSPRLEAAESHLDQVGAGCRGQRSWLSLVPFLSSSPFPLNPSPGPRRAWQPVPGLPSRGLQSRAQDGHGEGAAESMDSPPCSQVSRSQVLFTVAQVCLSMCAPMWVCASVYSRHMLLCGHVSVGTQARLPACVLGGIYSHVFAHFLFAHASTTVVLVHSCVHAGVCMLCAWVSLVGLVQRKPKNY